MRDFLFANPFLHPPGGGEGVANWMLDALSTRGTVTVLTWDPPDFEQIDQYYGTSLSQRPLKLVTVAPFTRHLLTTLGLPHHLLKSHWLMRRAKAMRSGHRHCFSAFNEMDLGPGAVQYVHHPNPELLELELPAPQVGVISRIWPFYTTWIRWLSSVRMLNVRKNLTITNSMWTAREYQKTYQAPVHKVIYPPPLGIPRPRSAEVGPKTFLSIGRIDRVKQWPALIAIFDKLRELGHDATLTLAGSQRDITLLEELRHSARTRPWLRMEIDQPREILDRLMAQHRYGIHGMIDEHYGMAVAELVLAGCITFVHDSGGQVEIVREPGVRYGNLLDAVEKIDRVLGDLALQQTVAESQKANCDNITRESFLREFHLFVDRLESGKPFKPYLS